MMLVSHALHNVLNNLRRTSAAIVIIVAGTGLLFLTHSYLQGLYDILSSGIRNQYGDLQLHHSDYDPASLAVQPLIPGGVLARVEHLLDDLPEVRVTSRELLFSALVLVGAHRAGVTGIGLEADRMHRGSASRRVLVAGSDLKYGDLAHTLVGEGVGKQLAAHAGARAIVQVHDQSGHSRQADVEVKGIVRTGSSFNDAYMIYVPLPLAQQLLDTDGVHVIMVFLRSERQLAATHAHINGLLTENDLSLDVSDWREVQEFYDQLKSFYDLLFIFMIAVVAVLSMVAIFAILSVILLERLRELGSLRAVGTTRIELLLVLGTEMLATYLIGALLALALGLVAGAIINALGITFVPIGSNLAVPFYIDLELQYFLFPATITLLMTAGATLIPVLRTARMSVADVLRHE